MIKQFNVLSRSQGVHQHYLLEASAGTGKTFSIQNMIVRLLIEKSHKQPIPLLLSQILVVTFTRAATRDLRTRIRLNIEQAFQFLTLALRGESLPSSIPDYLLVFIEAGTEAIKQARKQLQQALFAFDQAQIFTIHSFCARMLRQHALESDLGFHVHEEEPLSQSEIMGIIQDFFRTGMRLEAYSPGQLSILLKEDPDQKKLLKTIQSGYPFAEMPSFEKLYHQFCDEMRLFKKTEEIQAEALLEDFKAQAGLYKNYKSGETKAETLAKIERFTSLFDKETWSWQDFDELLIDGLVWVQALDPDLLKNRATAPSNLRYPHLTTKFQQRLTPLIQQGSQFSILLARLAKDCQALLHRYQGEEEKLFMDDFLQKMDRAINQSKFLTHIQSLYQAVIIDEFQDTDPLQWQIFNRLFLSATYPWQGYLYLVGDPKQSIYSFRQADVYTYLAAAQALGPSSCFSLDTNYRSQPSLVEALNTLFASEHVPQLIPLPKKEFCLLYHPVQAAQGSTNYPFQDQEQRGAVHFFMGDGSLFKRPKFSDLEKATFFTFIGEEILSLKQQGLAFNQMAILVRDRYQALRLAEFLQEKNIPYLNQRGTSLAESSALPAFIDVLRTLIHPQDRGAIKTALGGPLIAWKHDDLKSTQLIHDPLVKMQALRQTLFEQGFSCFFQEFMHSSWLPDQLSVVERVLERAGGIEFYHDLQQIADLIIDHQFINWNGPEGLIPFLDHFQIWHTNEDERVKRFQDPCKDGVKILTLHSSKGLEFDIVFALGLANRTGGKEELIPIEKGGQILLTPPLEEHAHAHQCYFEENDAEKMRQLYVALTRAKYRLYIPIALHLNSQKLSLGEASPMDLFIARLGQMTLNYEMLYTRIKNGDGKTLKDFLESVGKKHHITYSIQGPMECNSYQVDVNSIQELIKPKPPKLNCPALVMTSFSHLSIKLGSDKSSPKEGLEGVPHHFDAIEKTAHTLPANHEVGLFLHGLLEKIRFNDFRPLQNAEQALPLIHPYLHRSLFKPWENVIATLLFNALKTPISTQHASFCLADIMPGQMYREMPFLFPYDPSFLVEGTTLSEGFIKGVIDLVFSYEGLYYIVDWKSHWLGNHVDAYQSSSLEKVMLENRYFLQAQLYQEALRRYLKLVDPRPFEECFGGTIYLFLRGMQPGLTTGIYFLQLKAENLASFQLEAVYT